MVPIRPLDTSREKRRDYSGTGSFYLVSGPKQPELLYEIFLAKIRKMVRKPRRFSKPARFGLFKPQNQTRARQQHFYAVVLGVGIQGENILPRFQMLPPHLNIRKHHIMDRSAGCNRIWETIDLERFLYRAFTAVPDTHIQPLILKGSFTVPSPPSQIRTYSRAT